VSEEAAVVAEGVAPAELRPELDRAEILGEDPPAAADGEDGRPAERAKRLDCRDRRAHDRLLSETGLPRLNLFDVE